MKLLDGVSPAERPTAIMAANDRVAIGVMLAAARLGLNVPGDLSIMGYDDELHIADTMVPALTTMALPLREMGAAAMTQLLRTDRGRRRFGTCAALTAPRPWSPAAWWSGIPPARPGRALTPGRDRDLGHRDPGHQPWAEGCSSSQTSAVARDGRCSCHCSPAAGYARSVVATEPAR